MWPLMAFGSRMSTTLLKHNLLGHWEQRSIMVTSSRSNSWSFCMQCWGNDGFLSQVKIALFLFSSLILGFLMFDQFNLCHSPFNCKDCDKVYFFYIKFIIVKTVSIPPLNLLLVKFSNSSVVLLCWDFLQPSLPFTSGLISHTFSTELY